METAGYRASSPAARHAPPKEGLLSRSAVKSSGSGSCARRLRTAGVMSAGPGSVACAASMAWRTLVWRTSGLIPFAAPSFCSAARTFGPGTTSRSTMSWASRSWSDSRAASAPSSTTGIAERSSTTVSGVVGVAARRALTASASASAASARSGPVSLRQTTLSGPRHLARRVLAPTRDSRAVYRMAGGSRRKRACTGCMSSRFRCHVRQVREQQVCGTPPAAYLTRPA
jgi:hypothetical protein